MSKLDDLNRTLGANIDQSVGLDKPANSFPPGLNPTQALRPSSREQGVARSKDALVIPIEKIQPDPDQPREEFEPEALDRLAESLKVRGQLQPIRVRWDEGRGAYVIIIGERRWRAAVQASLPTMSCVVHDGSVDSGELLALQLVENALREDLKPVEQAKAFRRLMEANGWSGNQLAKELAVPQSAVAQALALLKLPDEVQARVEAARWPRGPPTRSASCRTPSPRSSWPSRRPPAAPPATRCRPRSRPAGSARRRPRRHPAGSSSTRTA